jgi:hypothetical protein
MRVKVVVTCVLASSWHVLRAGETHDLPDSEAQSLIAGGLARLADSESETATATSPEHAVARGKQRRRR